MIKLPVENNNMCENDSTTQDTYLLTHEAINTSPTLLKQVDQSEQFEPQLDNTVVFIIADIHSSDRITSNLNPRRDSPRVQKRITRHQQI